MCLTKLIKHTRTLKAQNEYNKIFIVKIDVLIMRGHITNLTVWCLSFISQAENYELFTILYTRIAIYEL